MAEILRSPTSHSSSSVAVVVDGFSMLTGCDVRGVTDKNQEEELSLLAILVTLLRKSLAACRKSDDVSRRKRELCAVEIGWPTNVRHVAHVTFDSFHGFLGLPVEFQPEVPIGLPSARAVIANIKDWMTKD